MIRLDPPGAHVILFEPLDHEAREGFVGTAPRERQVAVLTDADVPPTPKPRLVPQFTRDRVTIQRHRPDDVTRA